MKLYEIAIPLFDNAGLNTNTARRAFEKSVLASVGGYTRLPAAEGAWLDASGKLYTDRTQSYRLACDDWQFPAVLAEAFRLFPDQLAIFTAEIGTATIHEREREAA